MPSPLPVAGESVISVMYSTTKYGSCARPVISAVVVAKSKLAWYCVGLPPVHHVSFCASGLATAVAPASQNLHGEVLHVPAPGVGGKACALSMSSPLRKPASA